AAHVDDPYCFDPGLRWLYTEEARGLTAFDTTPELTLSRDNKVLIERIGMGSDLDPFAAAGDYRKDRAPSRNHPHVVLQLRHVFLGGLLLFKRPGQHEICFRHHATRSNPAIQRG